MPVSQQSCFDCLSTRRRTRARVDYMASSPAAVPVFTGVSAAAAPRPKHVSCTIAYRAYNQSVNTYCRPHNKKGLFCLLLRLCCWGVLFFFGLFLLLPRLGDARAGVLGFFPLLLVGDLTCFFLGLEKGSVSSFLLVEEAAEGDR